MQNNRQKISGVPEALRQFFAAHPKCALAFSGGSDSAYLLYAARSCGADVGIYYVRSCFQAAFEYRDALQLTIGMQCPLHVLQVDVLGDETIASNPPDRCYHCKKRIFSAIISAARQDGYDTVIDGTNASDDASDRPGMRALEELQVRSPLRECGITKAELRAYSKAAGLFTWNKPAHACLATRVPAGMRIREALLQKAERAENALMDMGFSDFRVRIALDDSARIQLRASQLPLFTERRDEIRRALADDFTAVTLDLCFRGESII